MHVAVADVAEGDDANIGEALTQPGARALCFWDARVHELYATQPVVASAVPEDKMAVALEHGGKGVVARTLEQVADHYQRFLKVVGAPVFLNDQDKADIVAYMKLLD